MLALVFFLVGIDQSSNKVRSDRVTHATILCDRHFLNSGSVPGNDCYHALSLSGRVLLDALRRHISLLVVDCCV